MGPVGSSGSADRDGDGDGAVDDFFRFNTDPADPADLADPAETSDSMATPAALAGKHGDWGGRTADIGPFALRSKATGKYAAFTPWPRDKSLVSTSDSATRDEATSFTLIPDGWGTVRIKESVTGRCLRVYETSLFRQRGPLTGCEAATNDRSEEEVRWVVIPAQGSNSSVGAATGGVILANYRNAKCLNFAGRTEYSAGTDVHLDSDCRNEKAADRQVYFLEGTDADATRKLVEATTATAITYATRNCADGTSRLAGKVQFDCLFAPSSPGAWAAATERTDAVCVAPAEVNNTASRIEKELTVNEESGWGVSVGREYSAETSLEPTFLKTLGAKVSAGLKLSREETWSGSLARGTKLTLATDPGYTSWAARELRVKQVDGTWGFGVGRLPWSSAPGPVRVPVRDADQLSYNSAFFNSNHPFPGCATRNKVEPTERPFLTQSGDTLTASPGEWPTADWTVGYRWYKKRGDAREIITGSDRPSFTRTSTDDRTTWIGVIVTAYRAGYAPTEVVVDAEAPA